MHRHALYSVQILRPCSLNTRKPANREQWRFFIDPLFAPEMVDKEVHAVDSEHRKRFGLGASVLAGCQEHGGQLLAIDPPAEVEGQP